MGRGSYFQAEMLVDDLMAEMIRKDECRNMAAAAATARLISPVRSEEGNVNVLVVRGVEMVDVQRMIRYWIDRISDDDIYRVGLLILPREFGCILGRGGEHVRALGKTAGVRIHISEPNIFEMGGSTVVRTRRRLVMISGMNKSGLRMAVRYLLARLHEEKQSRVAKRRRELKMMESSSSFESAVSIMGRLRAE